LKEVERMSVRTWFRREFSSVDPDDEASQREEFGVKDRGETELQRDKRAGFVSAESADLASHEVDALEAPRSVAD
jgi:hypothetical protein